MPRHLRRERPSRPLPRASAALAAVLALSAGAAAAFDTPEEAQAYYDDATASLEGAVHWSTLTELDIEAESFGPGRTVITTKFSAAIEALDDARVRVIGFIYPLEAGRRHTRFLLSALPPGCPFCLPGGPTTMIEVLCAEPVEFTDGPVVLEGEFHLLRDDPSGLYYRLTQARALER